MPAHLKAHGRGEWRRLAQLLEDEQRLSLSDGPTLGIAATAYENWAAIRRRSRRVKGDEFLRFERAARLQQAQYARALADLCLTPGTRTRAPKPRPTGGKKATKLLDFITRRD